MTKYLEDNIDKLPNILTFSRIGMTFIILIIEFSRESMDYSPVFIDWLIFIIFTIACWTDYFDGSIARKYHVESKLGRIFDPLADKMLMLSSYIILLHMDRVPYLVVFIILSREFLVSGIRVLSISEGKELVVSNLGKIKTVLQMLSIGFLMTNIFVTTGYVLLYASLVVTVYSGYLYFRSYYKG